MDYVSRREWTIVSNVVEWPNVSYLDDNKAQILILNFTEIS